MRTRHREELEGFPDGASAEKYPFAFSQCSGVTKKGTSSYASECNICGKKFTTSSHKMMYGHYLQKKGQMMNVGCGSVKKLATDYQEFHDELVKRWDVLQGKRTLRLESHDSSQKRQRALDAVCSSSARAASDAGSGSVAAPGSASQMGYAILPTTEKARLRDECQTAWDLAFVVAGIPFFAADNPAFKRAVAKTRSVPDFHLACAKTMRSTRLVRLNDTANEYKELRLKAGMRYGFAITSDGWRSCQKRKYHNYILLSVEGPIFICLEDTTGEPGTGAHVAKGFEAQFEKLGVGITADVMLGITDTPTSANQRAWKLLEAEHPRQLWVGCAPHEVSLLFKEWVKKVPEIHALFKEGHRIVKWVNNHSEILTLYRAIVPHHFEDKRKHCIMRYSPGDTRMLTVFKMLHRLSYLKCVCTDMMSRPEYEAASQKALKAWSDQQQVVEKLVPINGKYVDKVKHSVMNSDFCERTIAFVTATKSALFLHRLVDGQTPVLGKFYYACALVDKHLRVCKRRLNLYCISI